MARKRLLLLLLRLRAGFERHSGIRLPAQIQRQRKSMRGVFARDDHLAGCMALDHETRHAPGLGFVGVYRNTGVVAPARMSDMISAPGYGELDPGGARVGGEGGAQAL